MRKKKEKTIFHEEDVQATPALIPVAKPAGKQKALSNYLPDSQEIVTKKYHDQPPASFVEEISNTKQNSKQKTKTQKSSSDYTDEIAVNPTPGVQSHESTYTPGIYSGYQSTGAGQADEPESEESEEQPLGNGQLAPGFSQVAEGGKQEQPNGQPTGMQAPGFAQKQPDEEEKKEQSPEKKLENETKKKVEKLAKASDREIYRLSTVFPFTLFPNKIIIREHKVSIFVTDFFFSGHIRSYDLPEVNEVAVFTGPLFATLRFVVRVFSQQDNVIEIAYLKKGEALKARHILEGLISMNESKVDTTKMSIDELLVKSQQIGGEHDSI